jgi:hypothetical protein
MKSVKESTYRKRKGTVLIISMIFVLVFSALAVSMATLTGSNSQLASNQHKVNSALSAAESGLDCGKLIVATVTLPETGQNFVTDEQANQVWSELCLHLQNTALDGQTVSSATRFNDLLGSGDQIVTSAINFGSVNTNFTLRFYRYDEDPQTIKLQSTGVDNDVVKIINTDLEITKDSEVLNYAIASRGRMWLTGDTTIHGDVFSSWDRPEISPYNMTNDSTVLGTVNTVLELIDIQNEGYQLETLDANDNPIDANGDPLIDNYDERYYGPYDEIQAYHEGINYEQPFENMPGMDISDYSTSLYEDYTSDDIPTPSASRYYGNDASLDDLPSTCGTLWRYERFPHDSGNYTTGSGTRFKRYIYKDQTFTDMKLINNTNALFINCTFEGVLYIDCSPTSSSYTNNVRFDNCAFNGTIISDTPQYFNWQRNCLYFTGAATFDNSSGIEEATILAPHFNVNLGNTNPEQSDNNVLTGAIIGGIVDVRGNAQIYGTIISMCDTTQWSSGYVTNIGATLEDGGSETTELGDIGVIEITPDEEKMLPSGITSPIVIKPLQGTYCEG